jgi:MFS transporter, SP family, solute carrier family 2 (myo-inositol transporter), member 13
VPGGQTNRGKGTGIFQWLLTLGIVTAAIVGMYFSIRVEEVAKLGDPAGSSPLKTQPGAASSGFRCRPAFCL